MNQIKIAVLLLAFLALGTFWLTVNNEIEIAGLREEIARADTLHAWAEEQLADGAVIIGKYELYLALKDRNYRR
jgi:hypothetical protein